MIERYGRFRVTRQIGEGGMGVVYAAHDEQLDRPVAIKTWRSQSDHSGRERLLREARAAASVSHPNICQLYDLGEHDGEVYIAMELLEGEALSTRIGRGSLPVSEAIQIELPVLAALDALHRRGFIHRDLKPSNIFLTPFGVKLLDFGLARAIDSPVGENATLAMTMPGTIVGTPQPAPYFTRC
jgi:serine/threonine protein kinase